MKKSADLRCIWEADLAEIMGGIRVHSTTSGNSSQVDEGTIY